MRPKQIHVRDGAPVLVGVVPATATPGNAMPGSATPASAIRWSAGERLEELFEARCDQQQAEGRGRHQAVEAADDSLSYPELDARANRLARYLLARGTNQGDRIALLFDDAVRSYVGMLAVLKAHAVYVPLDPTFPSERISYIAADAGVTLVLTVSRLVDLLLPETAALAVFLDEEDTDIGMFDPVRLKWAGGELPANDLAYIIYTSGSTGRPKGVAISHASICHFVRVAAEVYGYDARDRVYQGMTTAFDFSVEEIWVPWLVGATLVPRPAGNNLLGPDLAEFINARSITALCCVPTLLATLDDDDVPGLRFLLVSGEACPEDLVERWHRPGRRFLNVYGPTEATVTATWGVAEPGRPVTLGKPLPGYSAVILDPAQDRALPRGELGEIGLAGVGLARGYVNRPDLTEKSFIPDFLGLEDNPSHRIYRTGDLGRFNDHDEIEYHGRADTQVKVRGYRIELSEIENVLEQMPGIALAVVKTWEPEPGITELAAYYTLHHQVAKMEEAGIQSWLRERLPSYMVPGYFQVLQSMPMMVSGKVDRKMLPNPTGPRAVSRDFVDTPPATPTEQILAPALAAALQLKRVSTTANFFSDLGANSLLMAHFCANVRRGANSLSVSMRDIYAHPTIAALAAALDAATDQALSPAEGGGAAKAEPFLRVGAGQYLLCGVLQAIVALAYAYIVLLIPLSGEQWIGGSRQPGDLVKRSLIVGTLTFLALAVIPIVLKWALIGRWKTEEFPLWSLHYVRFWFVKTLVNTSPLRMFVGTPIFPLYLRALGATIGPRVTILTSRIPACTDLLTVGADTVIRKDSTLRCYRAHAGRIQTGPVTLGSNVLIGEQTTLDIDTAMGDDAQLGHSSSLHRFQSVPRGSAWAGSPAEPTDISYRLVGQANCGKLRRAAFSFWSVVVHVVLVSSLGLGIIDVVLALLPTGETNPGQPAFWQALLLISAILLFGSILAAFALVATLPRLLALFLVPGKDYPLYGARFGLLRTVQRLTNLKALLQLTGDSSLIVYYLNVLGYRQPDLVQTGSNFGVGLKHDSPTLATVGSGTMVSDGLSIINADYSNTAFHLSPAVIGARSFFGNNIAYPSGARLGDNCLLGTKTMVPLDGPLREGVGLLGSPPFEIPRSVDRDSTFDRFRTAEELRRRIPAKNRHNALTVLFYLLASWAELYAILLAAWAGQASLSTAGGLGALAAVAAMVIATNILTVLVERASLGFGRLVPRFCSIYEVPFWRHERFWKLTAGGIVQMFNGTPFKPVIWRILGVRIGKRVFDDGCGMPERTLVTIGDYCTLNAQSSVQCHSMEDGAFKLDAITLGAGCTLGVGAFVHYGTTMHEGSQLETDSFLMKGEDVPAHGIFSGNPARELSRQTAAGLP